jgi:predicted transcriptional regulator
MGIPVAILKPSEVKAVRTSLGLSQAKLASLAGVTQAYIAKIEAGLTDPRFSTLERISKALEQSMVEGRHVLIDRIMSSPIVYVRPKERIGRAIKIMKTHNISQMPVFDGDVQVGSISEATIVRKIASGENMGKLLRRSIKEIMEEPFPTVGKDADIDLVYRLLGHGPAVLVIDRGKPVGIVTKADVFKLAGRSK